ncbi:MAG: helix-turn-helix domain-containing protein [Myxococcota bacterium]
MRTVDLPPPPALAPWIERFRVVEADRDTERLLLPNLAPIVALRYAGASHDAGARTPDAAWTGVRRRARRMRTAAGSGVILALLRVGAAGGLVGDAAATHEATVPLDALLAPDAVARALEAVRAAATPEARAHAFATFLAAVPRVHPRDALVARALAPLQRLRVGVVAEQLGVSRDTLVRRFARAVGAPPASWAATARLLGTLASWQAGTALGELAHRGGYADQSHLVRAVRAATGLAPGRLLGADGPARC